MLHGFDHQMQRRRIVGPQLEAFQHVEHLDQQNAAGRRWRHRYDIVATIGAAQRRTLDRLVVPEVLGRHQSAGGLHGFGDALRNDTFIKCARTAARDRVERARQIGLNEAVAGLQHAAVAAQEDFRRRRPARQLVAHIGQRVGVVVLDRDAVARHHDGWGDQLGEREFAGAVFLQGQRKAGHRAGHADRRAEIARLTRIGFTLGIQVGLARGRGRRRLAIIDGELFFAIGEMDDHEAAAADVAGARIGHRHREADRDRGVDGIAAALEHLDADAGGALLLRHHHAVALEDRSNFRQFGGSRAALSMRGRRRAQRQCKARCNCATTHSRHAASLSEALAGWYRSIHNKNFAGG